MMILWEILRTAIECALTATGIVFVCLCMSAQEEEKEERSRRDDERPCTENTQEKQER